MLNPVRSCFSLAFGALLVMTTLPASAGSSMEDSLALSMSKGVRDRMFWNLSVVSTKTKTKSEQPRDLTPEIVSIADLTAMRNRKATDLYERLKAAGGLAGISSEQFITTLNSFSGNLNSPSAIMTNIRASLKTEQDLIDLVKVRYYGIPIPVEADGTPTDFTNNPFTAIQLLETALAVPPKAADQTDPDAVDGYGFAFSKGYLTTPQGIRAKSGNPSETVALSVGYYLNDDQNWAVEALVLGAPLRASVYGAGTNDRGDPNQLDGQKIINTKMLPPMAKFGYYFGNKSWVVRPYVGVAAMYAIFFDTKTTSYFDDYQGGKTSISLKNAFGVGPFIGLQSDVANSGWRVGFSVGKIKIKTEATLVTRGTMFKTGDLALKDYKSTMVDAINNAEIVLQENGTTTGIRKTANSMANQVGALVGLPVADIAPNGMTTELMKDLAAYKQVAQNGDGTLGTFVRKQRSTLDNTIFMLSVGKSF